MGDKPKSLDKVRDSISAQDKQILSAISQRLLAGGFSEEDKSEIMILLHAPQLTEVDKARLVQGLSGIRRVKQAEG
jgi:chorismate mutase